MTNYMDYEDVEFRSMETNRSVSKSGLKIGKYLAVTLESNGRRKIYLTRQGVPFVDLSFDDLGDAVTVAEWLNKIFEEYFPILEIYPNADLMALVQWTIPQGIQIYEAFLKLPRGKALRVQDVERALEEAEVDVPLCSGNDAG